MMKELKDDVLLRGQDEHKDSEQERDECQGMVARSLCFHLFCELHFNTNYCDVAPAAVYHKNRSSRPVNGNDALMKNQKRDLPLNPTKAYSRTAMGFPIGDVDLRDAPLLTLAVQQHFPHCHSRRSGI